MDIFEKIDEWVIRYCQGTLSEEDRVELTAWIEASPENRKMFKKMLRVWLRVLAAGKWNRLDEMQENVWIRMKLQLKSRGRRLYFWSVRVAAVVILLIGVVFAWNGMNTSKRVEGEKHVLATKSGTPKALLVTDSGRRIELEDGETREVVNIAGVEVVQDSTGGVRFVDTGLGMEDEVGYNTIVVPERGEYFAVLSDGTKVWINSGSELVFPTRFQGDCREVTLRGEAYFDVVSDQAKPFYVRTDEASVRVLGTAFNVMSYREDDRLEVALLRGKVIFDTKGKEFELEPGEIVSLNRSSGDATVRVGDVEAIVAWTSGRFNFEDISLSELVMKLERWYGVKFVFEDERSKTLRFSGAVTKYRPLDYVLNIISKTTSVGFKESGESIVIYSK